MRNRKKTKKKAKAKAKTKTKTKIKETPISFTRDRGKRKAAGRLFTRAHKQKRIFRNFRKNADVRLEIRVTYGVEYRQRDVKLKIENWGDCSFVAITNSAGRLFAGG